jgi:[glutamine synthetase] adenylyltransferase / [glutamine synthetase]-adenylyl-L-tyrosine phosphorylase
VADIEQKTKALIQDLPDQKGAQLFLDRLAEDQPRFHRKLLSEAGLLSDVLALAAWSPLLATTLEQNPYYINWLNRERHDARVRTADELKESLARFASTNSTLTTQVQLARFRRRELLRIYLHDIRRTHTIVETTEELSNLADAILEYSLNLARQDLDNKYGAPQFTERGRVATAEFCIVALGKLGSHELNYASDIDLMFLYSNDGLTSGKGERGQVTNREYFIKLAETVTRLVGQPTGEGAAYRVDLRLRPFGRDGALASSLDEAVRYYFEKAQQWELQALIRARVSAGWAPLFTRFAESVRRQVFRADIPVTEALSSVRIAKQKIDRQESQRAGGFNVKLGRGGIREIEFVAQALQLAHAGRDHWLRVPHTLITLGRLADRNLITEGERTELSDAYDFLRRVEHRLQMEHGLQAHTLPADRQQHDLLARRMNFKGSDPVKDFNEDLKLHTENVRRAYERVFDGADATLAEKNSGLEESFAAPSLPRWVKQAQDTVTSAATLFAPHLNEGQKSEHITALAALLEDAAAKSLNHDRALMSVARVAASLDKSTDPPKITEANVKALVRLCGASDFFGEMIAANPPLLASLTDSVLVQSDYRAILRASIDPQRSFAAELSALRRNWSSLLLDIGRNDSAGEISLHESNRLQTELAVASINVAYLIARREMARRYGNPAGGPRLAILGLGRLASGGVDYGSDLDLVLIYDSAVPSPVASLTPDEAYARLGELIISALSSITRTGHLYHVDLRLRPDGNDGPLVSSSETFIDYLKHRAAPWEWLAYVKLRAVAGDVELGRAVELRARKIIHEAAKNASAAELQSETRRVRDRLEQEQAKPNRRGRVEIKYGPGGMLDVYFATRYLQLRYDVPDGGSDRSTLSTLRQLKEANHLSEIDFVALHDGYGLLRRVDHEQRLLMGRLRRMPPTEHPALGDIARKLGYETAIDLIVGIRESMAAIREAYERILR